VNDAQAWSIAGQLDAAVFAMAVIDEDKEAGVAVIKNAELDDLLGIMAALVTLITEELGVYYARDYFEKVRKSAVEYEATGKARMPTMRGYLMDDGLDDTTDDAASLIATSLRGNDIDAHVERVLKWASPAALVAEMASIAAALATRFGEDDWYTATRTAARAAGLS
jgi:hypothetical protein